MANFKSKNTRAKGCGLCTPWKRAGNSVARRPARDLRAIAAAKAAVSEVIAW